MGVVPTPGSCSDSASASSCSVRAVRGSNLQLSTKIHNYPLNSTKTVEVSGAIWFSGDSGKVVGCTATSCRIFNSRYNHNGEWAACLNIINIEQSDNFTYSVGVNPNIDYPLNSTVSKTFTFAVMLDAGKFYIHHLGKCHQREYALM